MNINAHVTQNTDGTFDLSWVERTVIGTAPNGVDVWGFETFTRHVDSCAAHRFCTKHQIDLDH